MTALQKALSDYTLPFLILCGLILLFALHTLLRWVGGWRAIARSCSRCVRHVRARRKSRYDTAAVVARSTERLPVPVHGPSPWEVPLLTSKDEPIDYDALDPTGAPLRSAATRGVADDMKSHRASPIPASAAMQSGGEDSEVRDTLNVPLLVVPHSSNEPPSSKIDWNFEPAEDDEFLTQHSGWTASQPDDSPAVADSAHQSVLNVPSSYKQNGRGNQDQGSYSASAPYMALSSMVTSDTHLLVHVMKRNRWITALTLFALISYTTVVSSTTSLLNCITISGQPGGRRVACSPCIH